MSVFVGPGFSRWRWRAVLLLFLAATGFVAWLMYERGRQQAEAGLNALESEAQLMGMQQEELVAAVGHLRAENAELRSSNAKLRRQSGIVSGAESRVRREISGYHEQISALKKELAFYRSIVAPDDGRSGLQLDRFQLHVTAVPRTYSYELSLIQAKQHDKGVAGAALVQVHGFLGDEAVTYSLAELSKTEKGGLPFEFRYFQKLSGDLTLPIGFGPTRVSVTILPTGGGRDSANQQLENSYHWRELVSGSAR